MGHSLRRPLAGQPGVPPSQHPRVGRSLTKPRGTRCTPVGLPPGLAPARRDTLHPSESALPHPGLEPVLAAAGSEDPGTGWTWSPVSQPPPGAGHLQQPYSVPRRGARLSPGRNRAVPSPAYPVCSHPGPRSLPAPPAAHPSPQAVLPVLSHTHTLSPVPARRARTLAVSSVRCQGTLRTLWPQPPFPAAPVPSCAPARVASEPGGLSQRCHCPSCWPQECVCDALALCPELSPRGLASSHGAGIGQAAVMPGDCKGCCSRPHPSFPSAPFPAPPWAARPEHICLR